VKLTPTNGVKFPWTFTPLFLRRLGLFEVYENRELLAGEEIVVYEGLIRPTISTANNKILARVLDGSFPK